MTTAQTREIVRSHALISAEHWLKDAKYYLKDRRGPTEPIFIANLLAIRLEFSLLRIIESYRA